ncbi:MAG: NAD-dependent epimerase/dehydratase family protein [Nanoarchaeota archaeon]|nr:NAD-dependent epimerase/dehydratase family protein [Nanoarchaeota archaeon]
MKVLVTGANGLIGQHLVKRLLSQKHEVTAFVRKTSNLVMLKNFLNLKYAYGDVRDFESLDKAVQGKDIVFHLAAVVHLPYKEEQTYYDVNVNGTENVLKACLNNKNLKKLVHCSSVGCYAPSQNRIYEDSSCHSQSLYGLSKYMAEKLIKEFAKKYSLPYVVVRPARVYGPGDKTLLPLFEQVNKGRFVNFGKMDAKMMPIYVGDIVDAFIKCMELPVKDGQVYNLAGPKVLTTKEFMDTLALVMDKKVSRLTIPMPIVKFIALMVENVFGILNKDPPISLKKLRFFTHSEVYDTKKAEEDLGFKPQVNLEQGLNALYDWYKKQKILK